jgi:pimeloyl-ACP methyl ester carboxylesterase
LTVWDGGPKEVEVALLALPEMEKVRIHGHARAFLRVGEGPPLLLLHGIGCDHSTWGPVLAPLAERFTVIAPDLLGHGASDKPRADYSLGGFANGMRDLLGVLGYERTTVVGHSFGGGVAMQFGYQFPERTERLVLVGSGGLGRQINPLMRALTLPGAGTALAVASVPPLPQALRLAADTVRRSRLPWTSDVGPMTEVYTGLTRPDARAAFLHVLRACVDWRGQVVTMLDRAYLTEGMPVLVVWGGRDLVVPPAHARKAAEAMPGARVEVFPHAGHFPHVDEPERFADLVADFVATTEPSTWDRRRWRALLRRGRTPGRARAVAS